MQSQHPMFPEYGKCDAKEKLDDLRRLVELDLFKSQFIDARSAARLIALGISSYKTCVQSGKWKNHPKLGAVRGSERRLGIVLAALFDITCNVEYLHGRMTNEKWIYCNTTEHERDPSRPHAYFSFLKQCPECCLKRLGPRLTGAQHKPSSHHIGEITTNTIALMLRLISAGTSNPMNIGLVTKQSHDVDAVAFRDDLLVLLEFKASPMVTFPVRARLHQPMTADGENGPIEIEQHTLITVDHVQYQLSLYLPHVKLEIPIQSPRQICLQNEWPYPEIGDWLSDPDNFLQFIAGWYDIFTAYRIPKPERQTHQVQLAYLANGWGDDIDSNKTKPGLGRTDDIKKGTYQLMKYGAYYRDGCPDLKIRGALVSNLSPLFMFEDYLAKLIDIRWARSERFMADCEDPEFFRIAEQDLLYLYDAVIALNHPIVNDTLLRSCFDLAASDQSLMSGELHSFLDEWKKY